MMNGAFAASGLGGMMNSGVRRRARVLVALAGCGLGVMTLSGCASSNSALLEANRALQDRNTQLTNENAALSRLNQELQAALAARDKAISEMQAALSAAQSGQGDLASRLAALDNQFKNLQFGNMIALDPQTDEALRALAAQYPDLLEYDAARGLLRFKADLTFDSGSDQVRSQARSALNLLAGILNQAAAQYDVRVVGHTDAQRLSAATASRHTTNIRLSADRAISVRNVLKDASVRPERLEIAGRGEFDPIVPNGSNGAEQRNRRVEIFLVKPSRTGSVTPPSGDAGVSPGASRSRTTAPARPAPAPAKEEEIMK